MLSRIFRQNSGAVVVSLRVTGFFPETLGAQRRGFDEPQCYHVCVSRAGFVLVGGASTRMGRDKALLSFHGIALAQSVAARVAAAAGTASLIGSPALYGNLGFPVVADRFRGEGPLGGILTALEHSLADWNLVAACDMPGLDTAVLRSLFAAAEQADADALVPTGPSGLLEPLCAVYHRRSSVPLAAAFGRGVRKIATALQELRMVVVPVAEVGCFQNVNTPEDWTGYAAD